MVRGRWWRRSLHHLPTYTNENGSQKECRHVDAALLDRHPTPAGLHPDLSTDAPEKVEGEEGR